MIAKQQINDCNDGQQLAGWAAEYCMGWLHNEEYWMEPYQVSEDDIDFQPVLKSDWQPHQPTEKGKAQAIDLAEKYGVDVDFRTKIVTGAFCRIGASSWSMEFDCTWQIAVLKAALLSEIGA